MDRRANIDLVFRNGLKDYEVLPPDDIWNAVKPSVRKRTNHIILKTAALIVSFISVGFLAYMIGRNAGTVSDSSITAFSIGMPEPLIYTAEAITEKSAGDNLSAGNAWKIALNDAMDLPEADVIAANELIINQESRPTLMNAIRKADNNISIPDISEPMTKPYLADVKPVIDRRWTISAMGSPTYYSGHASGGNDLSKQLMSAESPAPSYSGGVYVSYRISGRFSIQTGLLYASQGQQVKGVNSYAGFHSYAASKGSPNFQIKTASGPVLTNNTDVFISVTDAEDRLVTQYTSDVFDPSKAGLDYLGSEIIQSFNYLQMPITLKYKLIDKNLDINVIGGLSYDFLLNNSVYARVDGNKYPVGLTRGLNNLALSSSLAMGMEYSLAENLCLNLEPTFRYFLNPFNIPSVSGFHPYSFGIFSGLSYKF